MVFIKKQLLQIAKLLFWCMFLNYKIVMQNNFSKSGIITITGKQRFYDSRSQKKKNAFTIHLSSVSIFLNENAINLVET